MRLLGLVVLGLVVSACSSSVKDKRLENLPVDAKESIGAPVELVYMRVSEAMRKCYGGGTQLSVFENKRAPFSELGVLGANLSGGYTTYMKVSVVPDGDNASELKVGWLNDFWAGKAKDVIRWGRGEPADCR